MQISSKIKQNDQGKQCLDFLEEKFKYHTRETWLNRIREGRFTVENTVVDDSYVLQRDDILVYDAPPFKEPEADLNYSILYENDQFLAVNKPGNLLVHKKGAAVTHNLIYQLRECHSPQFPTADIVNRLDKETSGIVLVSKNKEALRDLSSLFVNRTIEKEYLAVIHGTPEQTSGIISTSIARANDEDIRSLHTVSESGKEAETYYEVLASWEGCSLIRLQPKTGRTHQLRLHCKYIGHSIVGDKLYSLDRTAYLNWRNDNDSVTLEFPRQALHCSRLSFSLENTPFTIVAPLPDDMISLIPESIRKSLSL